MQLKDMGNVDIAAKEVFMASQGWLHNFCKRHGIRELALQGEKLSADKAAAEQFI